MIIGTARLMNEEDDPEEYRDSMYDHDLDLFEGVEGHYHGIMDDLYNLKKLIELIGESVVKEEKAFKEIEQQEFDPEILFPSEKLINAWHKKSYRPFSYKAMFMFIQSVFENGVSELRSLMVDAHRLNVTKRNNGLLSTLKEFKVDGAPLEAGDPLIRMFNFIRNKVTHTDGYFMRQGDKMEFQELMRFVESRNDLLVTELKHARGEYTHRIQVKQSSVLKDYLELIVKVFEILIKHARNAAFDPSL